MSQAPTLEKILEGLPLNEPHLHRLALREKGIEEAESFALAVFGTQFGDDVQVTLHIPQTDLRADLVTAMNPCR